MLAVAIAFIVQLRLTRNARHPTIYEKQVDTPADSPAFREMFYQNAVNLLRHEHARHEPDVLSRQLQVALDQGESVALRDRNERLYSLQLPPGSPVADCEVRHLGLADMGVLIVGLTRGDAEIVPHGETRLEAGDSLLVACRNDSIERFRALITSSDIAGS